MAFIDEMQIDAAAGDGGDGVVRFRHEKFVPKGGPSGGDGGRGGNFYIEAVRDVHILSQYKAKKKFSAGRGQDGGSSSRHGAAGEDYYLKLPVGATVTNLETEENWQLTKEGEKFIILQGGIGGFGNEHFKSSTNTTPRQARPGGRGEQGKFKIELELFADVGLVGLPNAGKSSLLNALTNAQAKVGSYVFTTLDPNLGDFFGFVIADIPGLIEGAAEGKGLGIKFLKHIKRTRMLAHLISFEYSTEGVEEMLSRYKEIRGELSKYGQGLTEKEEIIILTKSDVVDDPKIIVEAVKAFSALGGSASGGEKLNKRVFTLSLFDDKMVKKLSDELIKILREV